ncbi:MAG TPA: VOC family protein [Gaiellaceae bacterium]|nr:VOC family protein [Gaiellaceae bacterium]
MAEEIGAQRVDFVAVPVQDRERAEKFYGEILGLERNPASNERWVEYETGNVTLALVRPEEIGREFQPLPFAAIAIRVPDVAKAKERLEAEGVEFSFDTYDSGVCKMAAFTDSEGNGLMIHHRYAPFADGRTP